MGRGRKLQIKFDNFFEFECPAVGGGKVCVSGKNSRTSSISAVTGGGEEEKAWEQLSST